MSVRAFPLLFRGGAARLGRVSGLVAAGWCLRYARRLRVAPPPPTPSSEEEGEYASSERPHSAHAVVDYTPFPEGQWKLISMRLAL